MYSLMEFWHNAACQDQHTSNVLVRVVDFRETFSIIAESILASKAIAWVYGSDAIIWKILSFIRSMSTAGTDEGLDKRPCEIQNIYTSM